MDSFVASGYNSVACDKLFAKRKPQALPVVQKRFTYAEFFLFEQSEKNLKNSDELVRSWVVRKVVI